MTRSRRLRFPVAGETSLEATLSVPKRARGLVVLARATAASRRGEPGTETLARVLGRAGLATLPLGLLTPSEARLAPGARAEAGLELELLVHRLERVTNALLHDADTHHLPVGYLGEGLGASVALTEAARHPRSIRAVVACGGVLAVEREALEQILAPTLFVVGAGDAFAVALASDAFRALRTERRLEIVRGAAGSAAAASRGVANLAAGWFVAHLSMAEHAPADDVGGWIS